MLLFFLLISSLDVLVDVGRRAERDAAELVDVVAGEFALLDNLLAALGVHGEVDLDVVARDLLAEEEDLLARTPPWKKARN